MVRSLDDHQPLRIYSPPSSPIPDATVTLNPSSTADASVKLVSYWHKANYALLGLFPLSFILSPSSINFPIDMGLAIALPFHAHVGMNMVLTDYVKKVLGKGAVRAAASSSPHERTPSLMSERPLSPPRSSPSPPPPPNSWARRGS